MKDYTAEDRAQREKLERMSSAGSRADVCGILNKMVAGDAARELPGLAAYGLIRGDAGEGRLSRGGAGAQPAA